MNEVFSATIRLGDDAMLTAADVAAALRKIADRLESEGTTGTFQTILDANGSDVGRWKLGHAEAINVYGHRVWVVGPTPGASA